MHMVVDPMQKFQMLLEDPAHKLSDGHVLSIARASDLAGPVSTGCWSSHLADVAGVQCPREDLEVALVLHLSLGLEVHLLQTELAWVQRVKDLAVGDPIRQILNLSSIKW